MTLSPMPPRPPRLQVLGRVAGLSVYLVSGEQVRNTLDIDFTQGGNEAIYPTYVPRGEIWLDDAIRTFDRMATTLHELVERDLMLHHGLGYDRAHDRASAQERVFRRDLARDRPREFDARRVSGAYRAYLRDTRRPARQLEREIGAALGRRSTGRSARRVA